MSNNKFYKDLRKSLKEVLDYKQGKIKLRTEYIEIPELPAEYKLKKIKNCRGSL
jgi:hypothetical protein